MPEIWWEEEWPKQWFPKRLIQTYPVGSMAGEQNTVDGDFDVLNTKCNTSFISRGRRIFAPVSDLGSQFNLILRVECFLVCLYSVFHSDKLFRLVTPYLRISANSNKWYAELCPTGRRASSLSLY